MATYAELKAQALAMFEQAEKMRKDEITAVIADIKAKMKAHALTVADLGGSVGPASAKKPAKSKSTAPAKYRGPNGELWAGGLGRKPQWVKDALAQGKSLDEFLI